MHGDIYRPVTMYGLWVLEHSTFFKYQNLNQAILPKCGSISLWEYAISIFFIEMKEYSIIVTFYNTFYLCFCLSPLILAEAFYSTPIYSGYSYNVMTIHSGQCGISKYSSIENILVKRLVQIQSRSNLMMLIFIILKLSYHYLLGWSKVTLKPD